MPEASFGTCWKALAAVQAAVVAWSARSLPFRRIYVKLIPFCVTSSPATMAKDNNSTNTAHSREQLPKDLQKLVDRQDDWMDDLYEGQ